MLRLTEVEVHGTDLGLGLSPWSETFVDVALPMRIGWLPTRRSNHKAIDRSLAGTWNLVPTDGGSGWAVTVGPDGASVSVSPSPSPEGRATLSGSRADLLGMLLGRVDVDTLTIESDRAFGLAFPRAFPPP